MVCESDGSVGISVAESALVHETLKTKSRLKLVKHGQWAMLREGSMLRGGYTFTRKLYLGILWPLPNNADNFDNFLDDNLKAVLVTTVLTTIQQPWALCVHFGQSLFSVYI